MAQSGAVTGEHVEWEQLERRDGRCWGEGLPPPPRARPPRMAAGTCHLRAAQPQSPQLFSKTEKNVADTPAPQFLNIN